MEPRPTRRTRRARHPLPPDDAIAALPDARVVTGSGDNYAGRVLLWDRKAPGTPALEFNSPVRALATTHATSSDPEVAGALVVASDAITVWTIAQAEAATPEANPDQGAGNVAAI